MSPLQSRKQLLIAESDLNRMLLARDYEALAGGFRSGASQFKKVARLASFASLALSLFKTLRL